MIWKLEKEYWRDGVGIVAGVDEVGRGCLCGPVVAAAFIVDNNLDLPEVRDSKKLSDSRRNQLYYRVLASAIDFAIGLSPATEVDRINVLQASRLAMRRAVNALRIDPDIVLIDGRDQLDVRFPQRAIIGGDATVGSIAAASIIAKVTRDTIMKQLHRSYPEYRFDANKGYGTAEHRRALRECGPSPVHRRSFSSVAQTELSF
jgi:ribonuclease HII